MASCGPGRVRDRHPGSAISQRPCGRTVLSQATEGAGSTPWQLVTDKLKSYGAAHRSIMPSVDHNTARYENNQAEVSHQPTRQRERQMRGFKSAGQAQQFLSVHGVIQNLFNLGRHQLRQRTTACCVSAPSKPGVRLRLSEQFRPSPCLGFTPPGMQALFAVL